ncbi:MAG: pyruvate ferredoxin oxidoreductase, partial [Candidatus Altiarchaeales archaeon IMC4]
RGRSNVYTPDVLVVLDPTLFAVVDIPSGLKEGGMIIINSEKKPGEFGLPKADVRCIDATKEAFDVIGRDIVNTAMLGAFAAFTGEISKESIIDAVKEHFPGKIAQKNVELVERVYEMAKNSR